MHILADSGATKIDWILFDADSIIDQFSTRGMNAMVLTEDQMRAGPLLEIVEKMAGRVPEIAWFYGAGLRTQSKVELVRKLLEEAVPGTEWNISHDLLGAARATCGHSPGITCILGTGSNSCAFDGEQIVDEMGGHGYLFGDEGSGADLGRNLIKGALDRDFPPEVVKDIEAFAGKPLLEVRNAAYYHPRPNNYFADFSPLINEHIDHPAVKGMVARCFDTFLEKTVLRYADPGTKTVHFIGSIAKYYSPLLQEVCQARGLEVGRIIKAPAPAMVEYHQGLLGQG